MYRSESFDKYLSEKLHDPEFAKSYFLELTNDEDEPLTIEEALRTSIRAMGITEFSKLIGERKSNVANFLNGSRKLKQETLNKYLAPFNLRVKLTLEEAA